LESVWVFSVDEEDDAGDFREVLELASVE